MKYKALPLGDPSVLEDKQFCRKIPHATEVKARKAMAHALRLRKNKGGKRAAGKQPRAERVHVYRCDVCGHWHWGHRYYGE